MDATYNPSVGDAEQNPERLRDLAVLHADGKLTQEAFRARRRAFIDAVVSGERTLYPGSSAPRSSRRRLSTKQDAINLPILVATACIIALLTLGSLYLIRDKDSPYARTDLETVGED
jgi:hypothetical protein